MLSIYNQKRKQKNIKNNQQGFTLVEVMIVLGIGAAIIALALIVVPTVLRNQRDTSRQSGVTALSAAILRWTNNRNGELPTSHTQITDALAEDTLAYYGKTGPAATDLTPEAAPTSLPSITEDFKIIFFGDYDGIEATKHRAPGANQIHILTEAKCIDVTQEKDEAYTDDADEVVDEGSKRAYAVVYAIEGETNVQCIDNT